MLNRLHVRVAATIAAIALLLAVVASLVSFQRTHARELQAAERALLQLGEAVRPTAAIAAYLDNRDIADDAIHGLARNDSVAGVALTSRTGLAARLGDAAAAGGRAPVVRLALASPFSPGEVIGELLITPRQEVIARRARDAALGQALALAIHTFLVALAVMWVVQRMFIRPLKRLAGDLHRLTPGEPGELGYPRGHARDEIGGLVDDTNRLLRLVKDQLDSERRLRAEIETLERRFRTIYERASAGIFLADPEGRLLMSNPALCRILTPDRPRAGEAPASLDAVFAEPGRVVERIRRMDADASLAAGDFRLRVPADAPQRWVHCLLAKVVDEDGTPLVEGILHDITDRKRQEQKIRFQAEHDPLTHLLNRRSAEQAVAAALRHARESKAGIALCLIDLDHFKPINDSHGHEAGDRVLVEIARRLRATLRQEDIAARLGGDEFLVAINGVGGRGDVESVARKLLERLLAEIPLSEGVTVRVGASMGIVLSGEQAGDFPALLALADAAMYAAKAAGRNRFHFHDGDAAG
jgi:diguanylate cyclase (GGDEF)-like protein/PAS domain S-box-containing protein